MLLDVITKSYIEHRGQKSKIRKSTFFGFWCIWILTAHRRSAFMSFINVLGEAPQVKGIKFLGSWNFDNKLQEKPFFGNLRNFSILPPSHYGDCILKFWWFYRLQHSILNIFAVYTIVDISSKKKVVPRWTAASRWSVFAHEAVHENSPFSRFRLAKCAENLHPNIKLNAQKVLQSGILKFEKKIFRSVTGTFENSRHRVLII